MTTRTLSGLSFTAASPAHYQLTGLPVELCFLGDGWWLFCPMPDGSVASRDVGTLEAGAAWIAGAIAGQPNDYGA